MASETGVLSIESENVEYNGRLEPGRMFLVDIDKGRIIDDEEIKDEIASRKPYRQWLTENMVQFKDLPDAEPTKSENALPLVKSQQAFGYSLEDLELIMIPMAKDGKEPTGSMGDDTPTAIRSKKSRLLYDYFKQLFAQVTNPPLDAMREELVTSLTTNIGPEQDLFQETAKHCHQFKLDQPILTNEKLEQLRNISQGDLKAVTLNIVYQVNAGSDGLSNALDELCKQASKAIDDGNSILILSDRNINETNAAIPALLATSTIHHHLIREGKRTRCGLVIESGEPREVHHFALLFTYGAGAINPYLAFETLTSLHDSGRINVNDKDTVSDNYIKAIGKGLLKIMSKMGISTLHSYRGSQIVECLGIKEDVVDKYFTGTPSRIGGADLGIIAEEAKMRHEKGFPPRDVSGNLPLNVGGKYQWRRNGEAHQYTPYTIAKLQHASKIKS